MTEFEQNLSLFRIWNEKPQNL